MKYVARYGKVWQDKQTGKILGREIELNDGDNIDRYKMIKSPAEKTGKEPNTPPKASIPQDIKGVN